MWTWIGGLFTAEHSSEWISGLTGAGGAILGSLVTILWTEWFNKRSSKRDKHERLHAGGYSALHRINTIYSDMLVTRDHLAEGFLKAHEQEIDTLAMVVRPMNRLGESTRFTVDELRALNSIGGSRLVNAVINTDRIHNVVVDVMDMYRSNRTAIVDQLTVESSNGGVAVITMTEEQLQKLKPRLAELDEHLEKAHTFATEVVEDCFFAMLLFIRAKHMPFGPKFGISLDRPSGGLVDLRVPKKSSLAARIAGNTRKIRRKAVYRFERWRRARTPTGQVPA